MKNKFTVICIDPPYAFGDKLSMSDVVRGAEANYSTMSMSDIEKLNVKNLADPDGAVLCLWVPNSLLQNGLNIMKAYEFDHKQVYIWAKSKKDVTSKLKLSIINNIKVFLKDKDVKNISIKDIKKILNESFSKFSINDTLGFGLGRLTRACAETCLIGTNNNKIYKKLKNKSQRSVSFAPNLKHSAKPENLQDSLELMFPTDFKIELFARRQRKGFICIGNQSPMTMNENIEASLVKLENISEANEIKLFDIINNYDSSREKELFDFWSQI